MTKSILIKPSEVPHDLIFSPAEQLVGYASKNRDQLFGHVGAEPEDMVVNLDFPEALQKDASAIGDTVVVYRRGDDSYHMTYIEFTVKEKPFPCNVLASILHNVGHKIWGKAVITKHCKSSIVDCGIDDVLNILYRRAWHTGILTKKDGGTEKVEMDNYWNVKLKGETLSLANNKKFKKANEKGQYELSIESEIGIFSFSLLDEEGKVIVDV